MALSSQEKLALALTSAGSMRKLAAQMGVSHQKVGRWLREGEPLPPDADGVIPTRKDGSRKTYGLIPDDDVFVKQGITEVFIAHKRATKKMAKAFGVPYDPELPAMATRKPLRTGQLGDRVFIEHTQFIKKDTRKKIISRLGQTEDYFAITVQSQIDLIAYADKEAEEEYKTYSKARKRRRSKIELRDDILDALASKIGGHKMIDNRERFRPIHTRRESIAPGSNIKHATDEIERLLREKMEPASEFGDGFAKAYILQLTPPNYEQFKRLPAAKKTGNKQTRKASVTDIRTRRKPAK